MLGTASRAVLSYALALSEPDYFVRSAILLVTDTINTDVQASCHLLEQLISSERLQRFGSENRFPCSVTTLRKSEIVRLSL